MNATNSYQDKYFSILGDSLSALDGYSQPEDAAFYTGMMKFEANVFLPEDTWWGQVIDALGGTLLVNHSIAGSMVSRHRSCEIPSYGCSDERTSALSRDGHVPDVILVLMGTNDWGCPIQPTPDETSAKDDLSIFSIAYQTMLEKLRRNYPTAEIWCCTLPVSTSTQNEHFVFPYCYRGHHIEEYCEIIRACAEANACRLIDLYRFAPPYDTVDDFHPNSEGMQTLSAAVLSQL
ncbi:MAG: SGNH/GDSL hydrolase family protein [Clostridia bacterium]|nr:SGNH/GDSL hydrolase family protein [Clostridia bacterium]